MDNVLDMTLPKELQDVVVYKGTTLKAHVEKADAVEQAPNKTTEVQVMAETNTNPQTVAADLQKAARDAAQQVLAENLDQNALAGRIQEITTGKLTAEAKASKFEADLASATQKIAELTKQIETAEAAKKDMEEKFKKSEDDKKAEKDKKEKAEADLAVASKKLLDIEIEKSIASRKETLKPLTSDETIVNKVIARKQDGTFEMSDESFTQTVAMLKVVFEAGKASQAPAAPAAPAQATASQEAPAAPLPANLTSAAMMAQAQAAMLSNAKPTEAGRKNYSQI